jgi:hypothetical protein
MTDSTKGSAETVGPTPMKNIHPKQYLQDKYPYLKTDLDWVFCKWNKCTKKLEKYRYPVIGTFDKTKCDVISDIVKGRQASKKSNKKVTILSAAISGLIQTEEQTFYAQSQLKQLKSQWVAGTKEKGRPRICDTSPYSSPTL